MQCEPSSIRSLLWVEFDRVLLPLGFKRTASTWLREDSGITLGINIQRYPMLDCYWINFQLWRASLANPRRRPPPDLETIFELIVTGHALDEVKHLCDFVFFSTYSGFSLEEQAAHLAERVTEVGVPWLEQKRDEWLAQS
jgi:hypothetical protein